MLARSQTQLLKRMRNYLIIVHRKRQYEIIYPHGFTVLGARNTMAFGKQRLKINVQQYFFVAHGQALKHADLPLLIQKPSPTSDHTNYYPIELLTILPSIVYNNSL